MFESLPLTYRVVPFLDKKLDSSNSESILLRELLDLDLQTARQLVKVLHVNTLNDLITNDRHNSHTISLEEQFLLSRDYNVSD
jgi:hypothetical protein